MNADAEAPVGAGVTNLTIRSDTPGAMRTVTMTAPDTRFFEFAGNMALNLEDVTFAGGAIHSGGTLMINGTSAAIRDVTSGSAIQAKNLTLQGDGVMTFAGNTDGDIQAETLSIEGSGIYVFNGGVDVGGDMTINSDASVTLNGGVVVGGNMTINNADRVTLGGELSVIYDQTVATFGHINVGSADTTGVTGAGVHDPNGTKLGLDDLAVLDDPSGAPATEVFIEGDDNSLEQLADQTETYESLLYLRKLGILDEENSQWGYNFTKKQFDVNALEANAAAAVTLFGEDAILDVPTTEEALRNVNGATGELFGLAASAQINRLHYLNRLIVSHTSTPRVRGDSEQLVRGQQSDAVAELTGGESTLCHTCRTCEPNRPNLWGSGYYLGGDAKTYHHVQGQTISSGGMLIGADWNGDFGKFGAFYGYGQTGLDAVASDLESNENTFGFWTTFDSFFAGGYTTALGSFSFCDGDGRRFFQNNNFESDYSAFLASAYLERGLKQTGQFWNANPYFAMQYVGYGGSSTEDEQLRFGEVDCHSRRTLLGVRLNRDFCLPNRPAHLSTGFAWNHELLDPGAFFMAERVQGGSVVPIQGNGAGRDWFEYSTGASFDWTENPRFRPITTCS